MQEALRDETGSVSFPATARTQIPSPHGISAFEVGLEKH